MSAADSLRRIVLIGPECTGKTWLARELAVRLGVPWSVEFARIFVETHLRAVEYGDVDAIGRGQLAAEERAIADARAGRAPLVIHDTDLVSTLVYSRHYFGDCPAWIETAACGRLADLYLLHHTDVPWSAEPYQREQPERRGELFALFRATLDALGAATAPVTGGWEERRTLALKILRDRFGK